MEQTVKGLRKSEGGTQRGTGYSSRTVDASQQYRDDGKNPRIGMPLVKVGGGPLSKGTLKEIADMEE
jgi:hypothetical protein